MICRRCGAELKDGTRSCYVCGAMQEHAASQHAAPAAYQQPGQPAYRYTPAYPQARQPDLRRLRSIKKALIICLCALIASALVFGGVFAYLKLTEPARKLSSARGLYERGDYCAAIDACDEITRRWPDKGQAAEAGALRLEAYLMRGECLLEEGGQESLAEAERIFELLFEEGYAGTEVLDGDRVKCCLAQALGFKNAASFTEAVEYYDRAGAIRPLTPEEQYSLVECLYLLGDQLAASSSFEQAAEAFERCYILAGEGPLADPAWTNYVDMTVADANGEAPPSKESTSGANAKVIIKNTSSHFTQLFLSGPTTTIIELQPGQSTTVYILTGYYNLLRESPGSFVWNYHETAHDFTQSSGGGWYELTLYEQ